MTLPVARPLALVTGASSGIGREGFEGLMKGEASVFAGSLASKAMGDCPPSRRGRWPPSSTGG